MKVTEPDLVSEEQYVQALIAGLEAKVAVAKWHTLAGRWTEAAEILNQLDVEVVRTYTQVRRVERGGDAW